MAIQDGTTCETKRQIKSITRWEESNEAHRLSYDSGATGECILAIEPGALVLVGASAPPAATLTVGSDICATGIIGGCSDQRFKKEVETIDNPIEKILDLRGVKLDWRKDEFPDHEFSDERQAGFIAQEIKEILPEVVSMGADGGYFVDYSRVTPLLVEAVKDQQAEIVRLKGEVAEMESVKAQLSDLTAVVNQLLTERKTAKTGSSDLAVADQSR